MRAEASENELSEAAYLHHDQHLPRLYVHYAYSSVIVKQEKLV